MDVYVVIEPCRADAKIYRKKKGNIFAANAQPGYLRRHVISGHAIDYVE